MFILLLILLSSNITNAQHSFNCIIQNGQTKNVLSGATVLLNGNAVAISGADGTAAVNNLQPGFYSLTVSHTGFISQHFSISIPLPDTSTLINLMPAEEQLEEVVVSSLRTNSRIEDLPTKVEVLGSEEVQEENGIKPGNIASLLGDVAGIQIQQTSASTGNADARIQGLPGKYTQVLRDGLPLFGGYAGSFGILQIPPADLKQIEIIKGSNSTLYGGGAIAGMINLVSKAPHLSRPENEVTTNISSLKEFNVNAFFSNRNRKIGYTFFGGGTYQKYGDVNNDTLSDVPGIKAIFLHPKLFFYPNSKQTFIVGYNFIFEKRAGGDMLVLRNKPDITNRYFNQSQTIRNTVDVELDTKLTATERLTFKAVSSFFNRTISTNVFGMKAKQLSYFTELSYSKKNSRHNFVGGINISGERFIKNNFDSIKIPNYNYLSLGAFLQDDWKLATRCTLEAGLRIDHHVVYGNFILPRISLLYKINSAFTTRVGGGLGYKIPSYFTGEVDEREYPKIFTGNSLQAEKSAGFNWDINYHQSFDDWKITINQMFYITNIEHPLINMQLPSRVIYFYNATNSLSTKGLETYVSATEDELELYIGYTYTLAKKLYDPLLPNVSLSARHKLATVIAYEFSEKFRAGIEAAYTGKQYLDNGAESPSYWFAAAMVRYNFKNMALVLNCENVFDYRQTKKEPVYSGSLNNPVFKQIWAPLEGRVINLSAKFNW